MLAIGRWLSTLAVLLSLGALVVLTAASRSRPLHKNDSMEEGEGPKLPDSYFERYYLPDRPEDVARERWEYLQREGSFRQLTAPPRKSSILAGSWSSIGPFGKKAICDDSIVFSGRIISFERDFHDPNVLYAGAASGGLWQSLNGGASWTNIFDDLAFPSVSAVASHPLEEGEVWIGTGNRGNGVGGNAALSLGLVYRSTDDGATWERIEFTQENVQWVSRIVLLPQLANRDLVFIATNLGIYRFDSLNGGWQKILAGAYSDLVAYAPLLDSSYKLIAAENFGDELWISSGVGWVSRSLPGGSPPFGRISLAASRLSAHDTAYASVASRNSSWAGVWRSEDFGLSWTKVTTPVTTAAQMNYNNAIAVHSTLANRVFAGANQGDIYLSTTSGSGAWTAGSTYPNGETHQDHHFILADGCTVFDVNDGGVWKSTDCGQNFAQLGNRYLAVAQIYHLTINEAAPPGVFAGDRYYIGTQDVGVSYGPDEFLEWSNLTCCDGGDITFRNGVPFSTLTGLSSTSVRRYQYPTNGNWCQQTTSFAEGLPPGAPWANRFLYDGSNFWTEFYNSAQQTGGLYRRGFSAGTPWVLWRSFPTDVTTFGVSPEGILVAGIQWGDGNGDGVIDVFPGQQVWVSDASGGNWTMASLDSGWGAKSVTDVTFGQSAGGDRRVFVTLSGTSGTRVVLSEDSGVSYRDITGDLPPMVNVSSVEVDPLEDRILYVGTDFGVYTSVDRGVHWLPFSAGLPAVGFITDLEFDAALGKVVVATYGRGAFIRDRVPVEAAGSIFFDDFESGSTSRWSATNG